MNKELRVWETRYEKGANGFNAAHHVTELLMATPHALVHFKIVKGPTTRLYTTVKAMGSQWWDDVHRLVMAHDLYRDMCFRVRKARVGAPTEVPWPTIKDFITGTTDLEALIAKDEKSVNAMATAMGHHGEMMLPEVMEKAKIAAEAHRAMVLGQKAMVRMHDDDQWGIF